MLPVFFRRREDQFLKSSNSRIMIRNIDQLPRLIMNNRLTKPSLIHSNHRRSTCHTLYRCHTEVFIDRNIDSCRRSPYEIYEFSISRRFYCMNIGFPFDSFQDFIFEWIILPIGEDEILMWHTDEGIDDQIDPLRRWESTEWQIIWIKIFFSRVFYFDIIMMEEVLAYLLRSKTMHICRRIQYFALLWAESEESIMNILRIGKNSIKLLQLSPIDCCMTSKNSTKNGTNKKRNLGKILVLKIK